MKRLGNAARAAHRRSTRFVATVAVAALALGACGGEGDRDATDATGGAGGNEETDDEDAAADGGDDDTGTNGAANDGDADADGEPSVDLTGETIRVTITPAEALLTNNYYTLDLLEEWGATVDRLEITTTTGTQAVLANQADWVSSPSDELILGASEGADLLAVASPRSTLDYVLAASTDIESVDDLVGRSLGMSSPSGFDALLSRIALNRNDVPVEEVEFVQIGGSGDRASALLGGRIDASTIILSDWLVLSNETDDVHAVLTMSDVLDDFTKEAYFAAREHIEEKPDIALAFACANLEANAWFNEDQEGWVQYALDNVPNITEEELIELHETVDEMDMFPTDWQDLLPEGGMQALADAMLENGDIRQEVDAEALVDRSFLEEAAAMGCGV